jgi:hypothetical protein
MWYELEVQRKDGTWVFNQRHPRKDKAFEHEKIVRKNLGGQQFKDVRVLECKLVRTVILGVK